MDCSTSGLPVHHQLLELAQIMSIESVMPSKHLILCRPLLLPPIFPSIRVFSSESVLSIRWSKYWSFSLSVSPSNECSGLISFRMDWFDLFIVQRTLKTLQHHSSKVSILQHSAFLTVQLSHPYMTTGKTIALTRWTFVDKVMCLLFNMLSRLVISQIRVPQIWFLIKAPGELLKHRCSQISKDSTLISLMKSPAAAAAAAAKSLQSCPTL